MHRRAFLTLSSLALLSACGGTTTTGGGQVPVGPDGQPLPRLYRIGPGQRDQIQFRMLDSINALRQSAGATNLAMNAQLTAAAATHARDMSVQNRPWHFGSDGSSPIDRVQRVGYRGRLVGETISETYETELQTLAAWMEEEPTRQVILDASARDMGFSWHQESNGKIWWCLVLGAPNEAPVVPAATAQAQQLPISRAASTPQAPLAQGTPPPAQSRPAALVPGTVPDTTVPDIRAITSQILSGG